MVTFIYYSPLEFSELFITPCMADDKGGVVKSWGEFNLITAYGMRDGVEVAVVDFSPESSKEYIQSVLSVPLKFMGGVCR